MRASASSCGCSNLRTRAAGRGHGAGTRTNNKRKQKKMQIDKSAIRSEFQRHDRDTGSSEVQIALLTKEIQALTQHLKANKKDHSSRHTIRPATACSARSTTAASSSTTSSARTRRSTRTSSRSSVFAAKRALTSMGRVRGRQRPRSLSPWEETIQCRIRNSSRSRSGARTS